MNPAINIIGSESLYLLIVFITRHPQKAYMHIPVTISSNDMILAKLIFSWNILTPNKDI